MGWGKKHSVVDYVFDHPYYHLFLYHLMVMKEMETRGYHVGRDWKISSYRGKSIGNDNSEFTRLTFPETWKIGGNICNISKRIYSEHDDKYLNDCLENLKRKGIEI